MLIVFYRKIKTSQENIFTVPMASGGFGFTVFGFLGGISARPLQERPLHSF